jgi:hypothetical protein
MSLNTEEIYKKLGNSLEISVLKGTNLFTTGSNKAGVSKTSIRPVASDDLDTLTAGMLVEKGTNKFDCTVLSQDSNIFYTSEVNVEDIQYGEYQKFLIPMGLKLGDTDDENLTFKPARLVTGHSIEYSALDFSARIYPNNYYGSCDNTVDGLLCIATGSEQDKTIVFVSDHDLITGRAFSGLYTTGSYATGSFYSGVTSVNKTGCIPSGLVANLYLSGGFLSGFNDYLKQSGNLTGTNFFNLYGNTFGNVNSGTDWDGTIPSGVPYSIFTLSTGGFASKRVDVSIYNTGIQNLFSTGRYFEGLSVSLSGELDLILNNLYLNSYSGFGMGRAKTDRFAQSTAYLNALKDIEEQRYSVQNTFRQINNTTPSSLTTGEDS